MIFKIIDRRTGKEPSQRVINNIARKDGLIEHDIEGFFVGSDGGLILADECGHYTYVNTNRITAIITDKVLMDYCKMRKFRLLTEKYYRELMQELDYLKEKVEQIEWIPVSEGLPEKGVWVLTYCKTKDGYEYQTTLLLCKYTGEWTDNDDFCDEVIAWRPLPEPYKKENEAAEL